MPKSLEEDMEIALTSISIAFSILNEILSTLALVHLSRSKQKFHRNHTILRYNFILGCYFAGTGTLASSICRILILNDFPLTNDSLYYRIFQTFESLGPNMFRLSFVSFMIERAIATQKSATYEKNRRFRVIGPLLVVMSILLSAAMSISYNLFHAPILVLYTIYISLDILSLMCALILNAINQKLQIINDRTDLRLSSRYQISENIRVFKFLYKMILSGIVIAALCTASSLSIRAMTLKNYQLLARISYFGLWNFYGCVGAFLMIRDSSPDSFICWQQRYQPVDYTVPIIRNVYGKKLAIGQTIDGHFKSLQEMWSNNCTNKNSALV